jgi:hypothetical protein
MRNRKLIAFVLSGVFPGLGQFYNGQWLKGAAFVVAGLVLSWLSARVLPGDLEGLVANPPGPGALALVGLLLAAWLWSAVDAWRAGSPGERRREPGAP